VEHRVADKSFQFRLVTPQGKVLDQPAQYVNLPQHDGQSGHMVNRTPFVAKLGIGQLRVDLAGGGSRSFLVEGGFAQMVENRLTVLTPAATPAETLIESDAEAELASVNARQPRDAKDKAHLQAERQRATIKVRMARARAGKGI
jgi:F-type H+-transporting ATPase subunit epsilon